MRAAGLALLVALAPATHALDVPTLTGRVVDLADVLSTSTEAALVAQLSAHEDRTSDQVVALTIPSLDGEVLESYATRVFRTWGLGQADRENGVLLLVAVADRELRIEVGYGLEGALTDAAAGGILRSEIVPSFRNGDFDAGVLAGVEAILVSLEGSYTSRAIASGADGDPGVQLVVAILLLVLLLTFLVQTVMTGFDGVGIVRVTVVGLLVGGAAALPTVLATRSVGWGAALCLGVAPAFVLVTVGLDRWVGGHPRLGPWRAHWQRKQAAFRRARLLGTSAVVVDGRSYAVPAGASDGGGASGSW